MYLAASDGSPSGDFIIYSGTTVPDGDDTIIAAYSIEANLGLYTAHGTT